MNRTTAVRSLVLWLLLTSLVMAQPDVWLGGPGSNAWEIGQNWADGRAPMAGDDVIINQEAPTHPIIVFPEFAKVVTVGESAPGQLDIISGGILEAEQFVLGAASAATGKLNVGGVVITNPPTSGISLILGLVPGSSGEVNLSAGGIFNGISVLIGGLGNGTLNLMDPSVVFNVDTLTVGDAGSSNGTVHQMAGTIGPALDYVLGATANATGIVNQTGGTTHVGRNLVLTGMSADSTATYHLDGGVLDLMGGDIVFGSGFASFNYLRGSLRNVGTFGGALNQTGGVLAPGDGIGTLTIQGDFDQGPAATYEVEIDGANNLTDLIDVQGAAVLGGDVEFVVRSRFPVLGEDMTYSQTILTATAGVTEPPQMVLDPYLEFPSPGHIALGLFLRDFMIVGNSVVAEYFQSVEGDTDGDSDVDITDFNTLALKFDPDGLNVNDWPEADFDQNGTVDITDFNDLALNFTPNGYAGEGQAVPEPSSWPLALAALVMAVAGWRVNLGRVRAVGASLGPPKRDDSPQKHPTLARSAHSSQLSKTPTPFRYRNLCQVEIRQSSQRRTGRRQ